MAVKAPNLLYFSNQLLTSVKERQSKFDLTRRWTNQPSAVYFSSLVHTCTHNFLQFSGLFFASVYTAGWTRENISSMSRSQERPQQERLVHTYTVEWCCDALFAPILCEWVSEWVSEWVTINLQGGEEKKGAARRDRKDVSEWVWANLLHKICTTGLLLLSTQYSLFTIQPASLVDAVCVCIYTYVTWQ